MVTTADDTQEGTLLIGPVMESGKRREPSDSPQHIRERATTELATLPDDLRRLSPGATISVRISAALQNLARVVDARDEAEEG